MPTTPTIKGDNTIVWGSDGVYSSGIIVSGRKRRSAQKVLIKDNNGFTVAVIYFDHNNQCEFEAVVQTAVPTLEIGDQIEIGGVAACLIDDIETMWENEREKKYRVVATAYDGLSLS